MELFEKGLYQYKKTDLGFTVINLKDNSTLFELFSPQKKETNLKLGCLAVLLAFIISSEIDFDGGDSRVNKLLLKESKLDSKLEIKRVMRGVIIMEGKEELGSVKFKKREFICKYTVKVKNKVLGELVSKKITYSEILLINDNRTIAKLVRSSKSDKTIGSIELFESLTRDQIKVLIGSLLLWV